MVRVQAECAPPDGGRWSGQCASRGLPFVIDECAGPRRGERSAASDSWDVVPRPAAEAPRPAAASRLGDHLAAGPRSGCVRIRALDRTDPRLARHVRPARVRDHVRQSQGDHVAGERTAHRQRRLVHPPRPGNRARRLVEPERLVDLRRDGGDRASLQVRDPDPRSPHLQPVELRPRPVLPRDRARARRATRFLVGADVAVDGAGARDHHRWRPRDPAPHRALPDSAHVLGDVRRLRSVSSPPVVTR